MKRRILPTLLMILLLVFALALPGTAEESYDASTMRLLRYEGDVQILDVTGVPRFVLENVRFDSGEALLTGEAATASVSMDDTKIVTLDESTRVEFLKEGEHMRLNLTEGQVFVDVSEKLDENASFDIQTTTLTVGIRGTLIFAAVQPPETPGDNPATTIGVLEGSGTVDTTDASGSRRIFTVTPGQILTATDPGDGTGVSFSMGQMTAADTEGFVQKVVNDNERLRDRVLQAIPDGLTLLTPPSGEIGGNTYNNPHPANKNWVWTDPVQLTAQSASKLYDGQSLSRTSGALVSGLPEDCSIEVTCEGEITDAGTAENVISSYKILNNQGEDVTAHFTNIVKVAGTLKVDRAPLTIWTGKAEKVYDGEPLTCADAGIRTVSGYTIEDPEWRNTSIGRGRLRLGPRLQPGHRRQPGRRAARRQAPGGQPHRRERQRRPHLLRGAHRRAGPAGGSAPPVRRKPGPPGAGPGGRRMVGRRGPAGPHRQPGRLRNLHRAA